jgi:hypothetical protein
MHSWATPLPLHWHPRRIWCVGVCVSALLGTWVPQARTARHGSPGATGSVPANAAACRARQVSGALFTPNARARVHAVPVLAAPHTPRTLLYYGQERADTTISLSLSLSLSLSRSLSLLPPSWTLSGEEGGLRNAARQQRLTTGNWAPSVACSCRGFPHQPCRRPRRPPWRSPHAKCRRHTLGLAGSSFLALRPRRSPGHAKCARQRIERANKHARTPTHTGDRDRERRETKKVDDRAPGLSASEPLAYTKRMPLAPLIGVQERSRR